jgi:DNA-binding response OmpR family regulator
MLPKLNGFDVCRQLRADGVRTPILMLTARDSVDDRIAGLDSGADDYLVKPFNFDELLARVRALLRRRQATATPQLLRFGKLTLDPAARQVTYDAQPIELSAKEFDVLELLMRHPRQVVTRETFYDRIWGYDFGGESNILEVYIRYLRAKMEKAGGAGLIQTVRGVGYVLREPGS